MPIAVNDIKNMAINKSMQYASSAFKNPFYTSIAISIMVSIILIFVFQTDAIHDRTIKVFKAFIYTFIITSIIIFIQTSVLLQRVDKVGGSFIDPGIISGDVDAMAVNKATDTYVSVPLRPDLEQYLAD